MPPILLPRAYPSQESRREACKALGLPSGLALALIKSEEGFVRYGRPGMRHSDLASLRENAQVPASIPTDIILRGMQYAVALDCDDPFVGNDITIMHQVEVDGGDRYFIDLNPNTVILTAIRTGLYLPGRVQVKKDGQWIATATGHTRVDTTSDTWVETSIIATYEHFFQREDDALTPTIEWEMNPDLLIQKAASTMVAMRSLTPLLDGLPCQLVSYQHFRDAGYQERHAKALERRALAMQGDGQAEPTT